MQDLALDALDDFFEALAEAGEYEEDEPEAWR